MKPESHNDVRYQRARDFLKISRRAKDSNVLNEIWQVSQSIWNYRNERLIKNWRYVVDIHITAVETVIDPALSTVGFSPCRVECSYTTVLEKPNILIGVSLGQLAADHLWGEMRSSDGRSSQPNYITDYS